MVEPMNTGQNKSRVVYSTDPDFQRRCPKCGQHPCACPPEAPSPPPNKQTARLRREKRQKGKVVTVVGGLSLREDELAALARTLKSHCGAGGTIKDGEIEVQGDHREKVATKLGEMGYKVKLVGG